LARPSSPPPLGEVESSTGDPPLIPAYGLGPRLEPLSKRNSRPGRIFLIAPFSLHGDVNRGSHLAAHIEHVVDDVLLEGASLMNAGGKHMYAAIWVGAAIRLWQYDCGNTAALAASC
jgi:hypothetical protein